MSARGITWMEAFTPAGDAGAVKDTPAGLTCHYCGGPTTEADSRAVDLEPHAADGGLVRECRECAGYPAPAAQLVPMDEQLGLDGSSADLAPTTKQDRLFQPAPVQIPGQLGLELEGGDDR